MPLAAIALAGTICTGFFALLRGALKDLTKSNERIADEAKQRNGHLADLIVKTANAPVNVQTVETQVVKEQK